MRVVAGATGQHDLAVRRDFDIPRSRPVVGDRHAPQLGVVLGGDDHLELGFKAVVAARELGAILEETGAELVWLYAQWLRRR